MTDDDGLKRTPLYDEHVAAGARMVPFAGWSMPLAYGSQIDEHHSVRRDAGVFDVSHMRVLDVVGPDARAFLRRALANDVARLDPPSGAQAAALHAEGGIAAGRALYGCLLAEDGGILDDLIVYRFAPDRYRVVVNAATADRDVRVLRERLPGYEATVVERDDLALLAVQGPRAIERAAAVLPATLRGIGERRAFEAFAETGAGFGPTGLGAMVARTGYTGEDGFEWALPAERAIDAWRALLAAGVRPAGLGARDTLRLEAGLLLYGQDMDATTDPYAVGLGWTVALDDPTRAFVGRAALEAGPVSAPATTLVGVVFTGRGVLRAGAPVYASSDAAERSEGAVGVIGSGGFSPSLACSIGLARLARSAGPRGDTSVPERLFVNLRGRIGALRVTAPVFVRRGVSKVPGLDVVSG